jgi:hypothetical protein
MHALDAMVLLIPERFGTLAMFVEEMAQLALHLQPLLQELLLEL